jgi:hypothetical protein
MNHDAIYALYSNVVRVDNNVAYDSNGKVVEIDEAKVNAWVNPQQYAKNRKPEYPDIGDQLDDLFKAGAFSDEMTAKIKAVKNKYPKG